MINEMITYKMVKLEKENVLIYPITMMYDGVYENNSDDIEENENYEILSFNWEE